MTLKRPNPIPSYAAPRRQTQMRAPRRPGRCSPARRCLSRRGSGSARIGADGAFEADQPRVSFMNRAQAVKSSAVITGRVRLAWCSFGVATTITGLGRIDQAARVGRLTGESSPIGAMLPG